MSNTISGRTGRVYAFQEPGSGPNGNYKYMLFSVDSYTADIVNLSVSYSDVADATWTVPQQLFTAVKSGYYTQILYSVGSTRDSSGALVPYIAITPVSSDSPSYDISLICYLGNQTWTSAEYIGARSYSGTITGFFTTMDFRINEYVVLMGGYGGGPTQIYHGVINNGVLSNKVLWNINEVYPYTYPNGVRVFESGNRIVVTTSSSGSPTMYNVYDPDMANINLISSEAMSSAISIPTTENMNQGVTYDSNGNCYFTQQGSLVKINSSDQSYTMVVNNDINIMTLLYIPTNDILIGYRYNNLDIVRVEINKTTLSYVDIGTVSIDLHGFSAVAMTACNIQGEYMVLIGGSSIESPYLCFSEIDTMVENKIKTWNGVEWKDTPLKYWTGAVWSDDVQIKFMSPSGWSSI